MSSRMTPRGMTVPGSPQQTYHAAPNAALLIDFDNVTMTIRSDLGKELRTLLNSEVIRGKVAVQRAYADWRRYPQYIVPLAENSVDLIFAPAYGSSKKNATDLRMAIDAIELVFTRPEIGTYILMTGDSDFSSCVLKLKEYGKYVIGVGMRESSSDLLIQNCDEYYSYHSLSGLQRAGEVEESREDPWVLVKRAVQQMIKNGDVMRTDRLKQVMLDLDPGFDEKKVGYSKFSRFVSEAASKNLLKLRKAENGQYEIVSGEEAQPDREAKDTREKESREKVVERIVAEAEAGNGRRGRGRGRGRDRDDRPSREEREEKAASAPAEQPAAKTEAPATATAAKADGDGSKGGGEVVVTDLQSAYALLQEAVRRLTSGDGKSAVRDGDVKRRMLEISKEFDESTLGFPKFTRFLRQAHEDEIVDLERNEGGNYEVSLPSGGKRLPPPKESAPAVGAKAESKQPEPKAEAKAAEAQKAEAAKPVETAPAQSAGRVGALRGRRGGRGGAADGPPPILPGQAIPSGADKSSAAAPKAEEAKQEEAKKDAAKAEAAPKKSRSRRGRKSKAEDKPAAEAAPKAEASKTDAPKEEPKATKSESKPSVSRSRRGRRTRGAAEDGPPPILEGQVASAGTEAAPAASAPGFPTSADEIRAHLSGYKGVGAKTAEALVDAFGSGVFRALGERASEVKTLLGDRRAKTVLDQFKADRDSRTADTSKGATAAKAEEEKKPAKGGRSRRGGRSSRGRKKEPASKS